MKQITAKALELKGTSYEIGRTLGQAAASDPALSKLHILSPRASAFPGADSSQMTDSRKTAGSCQIKDSFGPAEIADAIRLFDKWCPGLNDELSGFADALGASLEQVFYYAMTYLIPRCSQIALLPSRTANGHPLLARNYEFNDQAEDFTLVKTSVTGKYTHMGTSVLSFGRDDGFNEHGLAVTMSSNGFPVGASKEMRPPALSGLQFWAVIRSVLENCRDTKETVAFVKDMPIAYNLNLIVLDRAGQAALIETLDGRMAVKEINENTNEASLHATNHPLFEELIACEPTAMEHSLIRCDVIRQFLRQNAFIRPENLRELLLSPYPDGLCCHYYKDFFGTTKSMIIDPVDGTIELCWGGRLENGWKTYRLEDPLPFAVQSIRIEEKLPDSPLSARKPVLPQ